MNLALSLLADAGALLCWWVPVSRLKRGRGLAFLAWALASVAGAKLEFIATAFFSSRPEAGWGLTGGSFFGMFFAQILLWKYWVDSSQTSRIAPFSRSGAWRDFSLTSALSYVFARIGCLIGGCCGGRLTTLPWATHDPVYGLPVHPTQAYSILHGLLVFWIVRRVPRGWALPAFLFFMGFGRIITDFFRQSHLTGIFGLFTDVQLNMILGFVFALWALFIFAPKRWAKRGAALASVAAALCFLSGCFFPERLTPLTHLENLANPSQPLEIHDGNHELDRAVIFAMADIHTDLELTSRIQEEYPENTPSFEEVYFWHWWGLAKDGYREALRIPKEGFSWKSLAESIDYYEALGQEYDLILVTHGLDNMLKAGMKHEWVTWSNLAEIKGKIHHGRLVYTQACISSTLAPDWKRAGFQGVISYDDLVFNYFYADVFARRISSHPDLSARALYSDVAKAFPWEVQRSIIYTQIISKVLKAPVKEYIATAPMPRFD